MRFMEFMSAKKQVALEVEFVQIWCIGEVLCIGLPLGINFIPPSFYSNLSAPRLGSMVRFGCVPFHFMKSLLFPFHPF